MYLPLELLFFGFFCGDFAFALFFMYRFKTDKRKRLPIDHVTMLIFASSALWSFGVGLCGVQTDSEAAYFWRCIGIAGTFIFMSACQSMMSMVSDLPKKIRVIFDTVAYSGIIVYFLYVQPGITVFVRSPIGMTFYFKQCLTTTIYASYFTLVSANLLMTTIYMVRKNERKQLRAAGKKFFIVELLIFFGAVFDMVAPSLGKEAYPGSALTHFWGVVVFWYILKGISKSQITIANMSEYIYYSLDIPVLVFDASRKLRIINNTSESFFDLKSEDVEKGEYEIRRLFENIDSDVFEFEGKSSKCRAKCTENDAECQLEISRIEDDYGDTVGYITIVNNMNDHILAMRRLEEAKLMADAANTSKSLFLANMSHEIRTPMNAILGFAELALDDDIDDISREYFADIKRSGETLLSTINDVLNISKIELGRYELVNNNYKPAQIFNDVSLIINSLVTGRDISFEMKVADDFPEELYGDKDRIREILINLLNNSVKYTRSGRVVLEARIIDHRDSVARVEFKIIDTGIGIKQEDIDKIFEKFQRVDAQLNSQTEGTGLGLSITRGLVGLMGGDIRVESIYGVGSTFTVEIDQTIVDDGPIQMNREEKEEHRISKHKLHFNDVHFLAVDDNKINLKVVSKIMQSYGILYDTASSGMEAIELCKKNLYDVVLMDQMMPVMDGIEAMTKIRDLEGYSPSDVSKIVALTANVVEGVEDELIAVGFDGYIGKPIDFTAFEKVLCRVLPKERYYIEGEEAEGADDGEPEISDQDENSDFIDEEPKEVNEMVNEGIDSELLVINREMGLDNFGGDEESLKEIMGFMVEGVDDDINELLDYYNDNDIENFVIKVHGMKSQCNYVGGENIGAMAKMLEFAGKDNDIGKIDENIEKFTVNYKAFCKAVNDYING